MISLFQLAYTGSICFFYFIILDSQLGINMYVSKM